MNRDIRMANTFWEWIVSDETRVKSISEIRHSTHSKLPLIPQEIVKLSNLRILQMTNGQLILVPEFVAQLQQLEVLDLNHNSISASFCDFAQMPKLRYLNLSHNRLDVLPSPHLFQTQVCLCVHVDANTLLNSNDVLQDYTSIFFVFTPPSGDCDFSAEFLNSIILHNSRVFHNALTSIRKFQLILSTT